MRTIMSTAVERLTEKLSVEELEVILQAKRNQEAEEAKQETTRQERLKTAVDNVTVALAEQEQTKEAYDAAKQAVTEARKAVSAIEGKSTGKVDRGGFVGPRGSGRDLVLKTMNDMGGKNIRIKDIRDSIKKSGSINGGNPYSTINGVLLSLQKKGLVKRDEVARTYSVA